MPAFRSETVTAPDGGTFAATLVLPDDTGTQPVPGVLLLQEIFGVNDFLLTKASDLAQLGYAVLCPDVFWRVQPGVALAHDGASLQEAFGHMTRFAAEVTYETRTADLGAALDHLRSLPEVGGKVAVMGYCLGGRLAYEVAATAEPDACVSYYGAGVAAQLDSAPRVTCPALFHFGAADPYIPADQVDAVRAAFARRPDVEFHVQADAGHAFENHLAPQFHDPAAAERSWPVTVAFLERTLRA